MTRNELEFIKQPQSWPQWPYMPLVKRGGSPFMDGGVGILSSNDVLRSKPVVYLTNLFSIGDRPLAEVPSKTYESFEAMLNEWRVD